MKIYISGQISGLPIERVEINFTVAHIRMEEEGYEVFNPLLNGIPADSTWEEHMKADIKMLMQCDAIYLLNNWEDSKGARIERDIAVALGYLVIEQIK